MKFGAVYVATAAILLSGGAVAATQSPKAVAHARHEGMEAIGKAFTIVNKQLRSGSPNAAVVRTQAAAINRLAIASNGWFTPGSGPGQGFKTHAKAAIWTDAAGFRTAQQNFLTEAAKFDQVARGGNIAAVAAQAKALGGTCKGCHDKFAEED